MDPLEDLHRRRPYYLALEDPLYVVGQGLAPSLRLTNELSMKTIRDIANLEHLGHEHRI